MNPDLVLDCSIPHSVCFREDDWELAYSIIQLTDTRIVATTSIFPLELANGIAVGVRRNRIAPEQAQQLILQFSRLPLLIDEPIQLDKLSEIHELAGRHQLSSYDASYPRTALHYRIPLATFDRALLHAAAAEGLPAFKAPV